VVAIENAILNEELEERVRERTAELEEREKRFRTLADLTPVGIYETDEKGHCHYVNEHWMDMSGLTYEEAMDDIWVRRLHQGDRQPIADSWYEMVQSKGHIGLEYRFKDRAGRQVQGSHPRTWPGRRRVRQR